MSSGKQLQSRSRLEPTLLGWSCSRYECWPEPRAGAAFFKVAPAASFWQAEKESLVVVTKPVFRIRVFFRIRVRIFFLSLDPDRPKIRIRSGKNRIRIGE